PGAHREAALQAGIGEARVDGPAELRRVVRSRLARLRRIVRFEGRAGGKREVMHRGGARTSTRGGEDEQGGDEAFHGVSFHKRTRTIAASERPGSGYWKRSCSLRSSRTF